MIVKVSTIINTTPEVFWKEIQKPKSLQYISAPIRIKSALTQNKIKPINNYYE